MATWRLTFIVGQGGCSKSRTMLRVEIAVVDPLAASGYANNRMTMRSSTHAILGRIGRVSGIPAVLAQLARGGWQVHGRSTASRGRS
jgi:hypothetical protein